MKKAVLILLPLILLGTGAGLVLTGIVKIPGVSLGAKKKANSLYTPDKEASPVAKKTESPKKAPAKETKPPAKKEPKVEITAFDNKPEVGQKKLAKLWNEMEPGALTALTKDWTEKDLAAILVRMDNGKVAEFLTGLEAKRASRLSKELQKQASIVPHETGF